MSGYDEEHNISRSQEEQREQSPRVNLESFFSQVDRTTTENTNTLPEPPDVTAAFRMLATAFNVYLGRSEAAFREAAAAQEQSSNPVLEDVIMQLMLDADDPPRELNGVPESFFDELERVPKKDLKPDQSCPICNNPFLEDKYPLVVRLPCHPDHIFDMECIRPWLKLKSTCPLDRKDLVKKKQPPTPPGPTDEEEDGEWDEMYA